MTAPVAIVDLGSNSVRLFLSGPPETAGPAGERITTVTALRRGAAADGSVAADALERLDACLSGYAARIADAGATAGTVLGTSAVRDAPNRHLVAEVVARRLGLPLTVLTGEQEAGLAFAGARLAVRDDGPVLVLDVGGASTELVRGAAGAAPRAVSLQLGGVRSSEAHLHGDPPRPDELAALREAARPQVAAALAEVGWPGADAGEAVIGVAGTITTLAAIEHGRYDPALVHGCVLTATRVEALLQRLAALPLAERERVPGLEPARAPAIVGGAAIATVVLEESGADALTVSERDLLDGAAMAADALATPILPGCPPLVRPAGLT